MTGRRRPRGVSQALVLIILALTVACQGTTPPAPAESPSPDPSLAVLDAVTSRRVGGDYAPVDVTSQFAPADAFYCVVQVANAGRDTEIIARWYFGNSRISEAVYVTEEQGTGYVAFELTNQQPWPEGLYRVEILSAGVVLRSVEFWVAE